MRWINNISGWKVVFVVLFVISSTTLFFKTEDHLPDQDSPLIIYWTSFFHYKIDSLFGDSKKDCPYTCTYMEREEWQRKYSSMVPSAYIIHNRDAKLNDLPDRKPHQLIVFLLQESPIHAGQQIYQIPKDYYNATMTYRQDSDYFLPYKVFRPVNGKNDILWDSREVDKALRLKTRGALAFISNCNTSSGREVYIQELMKYTNVTIYGCDRLKTVQGECPSNSKCEDELTGSHRFYLSFENAICKDYITEKFFKRLDQLLVPVVMRRRIVNISTIPYGSFIAADDFDTPQQLGEYLNHLMDDEKEYKKFFDWTKHYQKGLYVGDALCKLCTDIHNNSEKRVANIIKYFIEDGECESPKNYAQVDQPKSVEEDQGT